MSAMSEQKTPSQAAWNRFADQLKEVGEKITGPIGARTSRERAEGFRYLASLIAGGHEIEMEADRAHPVLVRAFTPIRSFVGDGPDTLYHDAKLDESLSYEFTIRRGDDIFFSIVVYASDDEDGSFRLYACRDNPGVKNWISTEGRRRGQLVLRTLLAETDLMPEMSVIKLSEIPDRDRV